MSELPISYKFKINIFNLNLKSNFNCPLMMKGMDDLLEKIYERFPAVFLSERTG